MWSLYHSPPPYGKEEFFEMTDKNFDTIPREVIELGSKLTAAELRCVIDMLKANLYGDAAGKCQPKDAEKEI